jgi:hypothetical protein
MKTRCLPLLAALLVAPTLAFADGAADRILGIAAEGGSAEWDAAVRLVLLANYDLDGSGVLDKAPEVEAVSCATWKALDARVREKWAAGFRVTYGFPPDRIWVGEGVGVSTVMRGVADGQLAACESDVGTTQAETRPAFVEIALAAPEMGGQEAWDGAVRPILLDAYDADGSGWLDTTEEIAAIPCETLDALDVRVKESDPSGLRTTYGLQTGPAWRGDALGFVEPLRAGLDMRLVGCASAPPASTTAPAPPSGGLADRIGVLSQPPGEDSWDAAVAALLLGTFDADASGWLDRESEIGAVTCDVWDAVDAGVRRRWEHGLRQTYGLVGGYIWVGDALGIDERVRLHADATSAGCGLKR